MAIQMSCPESCGMCDMHHDAMNVDWGMTWDHDYQHSEGHCDDDQGFKDVFGYDCASWDGYDCTAFEGYQMEDLTAVMAACPKSCKLCSSETDCTQC